MAEKRSLPIRLDGLAARFDELEKRVYSDSYGTTEEQHVLDSQIRYCAEFFKRHYFKHSIYKPFIQRSLRHLIAIVTCFGLVGTAHAEICVFPLTLEVCTGSDCIADFEQSSDSGPGANASVNLGERRVQVRASGGAGIREANGIVGIRHITPERTTDVDFSTVASFSGVLQGGIFPTSFGRVRVWSGVRNLDTGATVEEVLAFDEQQDSNDVLVLPQIPLQAITAEFTATLEEGTEYAVYFRVKSESRGATSNSDFRSGLRGIYFQSLEMMPTSEFPDADGDSLFDDWENDGIFDCDDNLMLNLSELGATSDHKDIFIEYDWTPGNEPEASSIAAVKEAFKLAPIDAGGVENPDGEDGIRLWIDTGDPATGDDLEGGQEIDLEDVPNGSSVPKFAGDFDGNGVSDFYDVKKEYFDANRRLAFHYLINSGSGTTEQGAGPGSCSDNVDNDDDGLVDYDDIANCHRNSQAERPGNDIFMSFKGPGLLMHELGHNLNLRHGGDQNTNCKPNYVSVMNYNMQTGIPQDNIMGQDTNYDGMPDNKIVDYSPPRFPGGRGTAPLDEIDEEMLDEGVILDPSDPENQTLFIDGTGATQTVGVDQPLDWAGDGSPPDANDIPVNVNSGPASGCSTSPADDDPFTGHDDWSKIQMNFRLAGDFDDSAKNPTEEPEPTQEDLDALDVAIYTTDLRVTKTAEPDPVVAGQPLTIGLIVENLGPNHTQEVAVRDQLPEGIELLSVPDGCELSQDGQVSCLLGRMRTGESREISLLARVRRDMECREGEQFTFISSTAEVENLAGGDPNRQNDRSTVRIRVMCVNYEYPAKLICGKQGDPDVLRLMSGLYGTTVNIHNPNDQETYLFKKLALAFPPVEQKPGKIIPIAVDRLNYDESLKTDCDEIRERVFDGAFPQGYIEGHLVVQSARSLDVQGVYTAAPLQGGVSTIDVEYVPERDVRPDNEPLPDLIIDTEPLSIDCNGSQTSQQCDFRLKFRVRNIGEAVAGPHEVEVTAPGGFSTFVEVSQSLAPEELAFREVDGQFIFSRVSGDIREICLGADEPDDVVDESKETNNGACIPF